jgi:hypothetical protein
MAALTRRYIVMTLATEGSFDPRDPDGAFVLKPWKDPAALRALRVYRDNCFPELRRDIDAWIRAIEAGPALRGDIGRRNERHLQVPSSPRRAAPTARPAAPRKPATRRRR